MPKFQIDASAQLENIESITIPDDYPWHLQLICGNCGEIPDKPIVVMKNETVEGIRGASVHLRMTCKLCKRLNDIKIISDAFSYTKDHVPNWSPILILECRGIEPTGITLPDDTALDIAGEDGFKFEDAFIEDGEFFGWDDKRSIEASITEFRTRVIKA